MIGGHGRPAPTRLPGLPARRRRRAGGRPRLTAALAIQLERWRATLAAGATRVGWKLGVGDAERIGDELAVGHLTSATLLAPGAAYAAGEQLQPGDRLITGSVVQVPVRPGHRVTADLGPLGWIELTVTA